MGWRNGGYASVLLVAVGAAMWGTDAILRVPLLEVASPSQIVLLEHLEHIQHYVDLGFDEVYVHNVGRNQEEFIRAYGERVIPELDWPEKG